MKTILEAMHNLKETIEYEKDYQTIFSEIDLKDIGNAVYDCIKENKLSEAAVQVILNKLKSSYNIELENCNKLEESKSESEILKFLKDSVNTLQTSDYTNCKLDLDDKLAIFVGWSAGFGNEKDNSIIQSESNPDWAICAGIKERNDVDWADYDSLSFVYDKNSGDPVVEDYTLSPDGNYTSIAKALADDYETLKEI